MLLLYSSPVCGGCLYYHHPFLPCLVSFNRAGDEAGDRDWGYSVPRGRSRYRQAAAAVAAAVATGDFM